MRLLAWIFFLGYVGLLIAAGAWGIFAARLDQRVLLGLDLAALRPSAAASMVGQYRFLRAMELGFGLFAILYRRQIFTRRDFNRLFLGTMAAGVLARLVSLALDGAPRPVFYLFLAWESAGVVIILLYTRNRLVAR